MKRIVLTSLLLFTAMFPARAQWDFGVTVGAALPWGASENAPALRTSYFAGVRSHYHLSGENGWQLLLMVDGVRWMSEKSPDVGALPLDTMLYAKRYFLLPVTFGVGYSRPLASRCHLDAYATVGGYYRLLNCQRMRSAGVMYDMEEHGLGFALKAGADLRIYNWSLGISLTALGNPFEKQGPSLPHTKAVAYEFSQPTLEGYRQCFLIFEIGYWLTWK